METLGDENTSIAGKPFVTKLLERLGVVRLNITTQIFSDRSPLEGYAILIVFLEVFVLQIFNLLTGRTVVFVENPLWLIRPITLIGAAIATELVSKRYDRAVIHSKLQDRTDSSNHLRGLVPDKLSALIIAGGVIFTFVNAVFILTVPQLYSAGGPARVFRFVFITPFGYVPIFGTFLATYIAIEVLTPLRISKSEVNIDFLDPENLGGMRPVGELLKYAYYFVMIGLVAYAVATYGPFILEGPFAYNELSPPGRTVNVVFTALWIVLVGVMVAGFYQLHRFMRREKQEELHRLDELARKELEIPWDIQHFDAADPSESYESYREKVNFVTATKEYPTTFTMWTQLLLGVMLPKAVQLVLSTL